MVISQNAFTTSLGCSTDTGVTSQLNPRRHVPFARVRKPVWESPCTMGLPEFPQGSIDGNFFVVRIPNCQPWAKTDPHRPSLPRKLT